MTVSTHRRPRRSMVTIATVMAVAATVAACSGDDDSATTTTITPTTTTIAPTVVTDGRLVIGLMLPADDSLISEPVEQAVDTAIDRINAAGGVLGQDVRAVTSEEGETPASAASAIQSLLALGVDAIVGPSSSVIALGTLDEIVAAGKVSCSPTASAMALDAFPDNGLFFRTVPSDSLQAQAIAQAADQTGAQQAAIVFVDDAYGRDFADAVESTLRSGAMGVVESIPFRGDDDSLTDEVDRLLESEAQVAIVLAGGDDGWRFIDELNEADHDQITNLFVNDALRQPSTPQRVQDLDASLRDKVVGIGPQSQSPDPATPFDPPGAFAANAYDCVNLIALGTVLADSDAPRDIAARMSEVSSSGSVCRSFSTCVDETAAGLQINYDGPSGLTEIQPRQGDPARAVFDRFTFDAEGRDVFQRSVTVGS